MTAVDPFTSYSRHFGTSNTVIAALRGTSNTSHHFGVSRRFGNYYAAGQDTRVMPRYCYPLMVQNIK